MAAVKDVLLTCPTAISVWLPGVALVGKVTDWLILPLPLAVAVFPNISEGLYPKNVYGTLDPQTPPPAITIVSRTKLYRIAFPTVRNFKSICVNKTLLGSRTH